MKLYLYNYDYSEQSVRQMQTIISFLDGCDIILDKEWRKLLIDNFSVEFMGFVDFLQYTGKRAIVYFNILDGYHLRKYKNSKNLYFIFRPRGLSPEESYYKHHNFIRKLVLNYIENHVIRLTDYFIFLGNSQRIHFLSKYQKYTSKFDHYKIIPNINIMNYTNKNLHKNDKDTIKMIYSGGFSKWQNIELIFMIVSKIIMKNNEINSNKKITFTILTFQKNFEIVKEYACRYGIINEIDYKYVSPSEINDELIKYDIGIIIRDNNIVNIAASPFKIMDYISNGIGLILTDNAQIKNILQSKFYFQLDFTENLNYDDKSLMEFILGFVDGNPKKDIIDNYKSYVLNVKKINFNLLIGSNE